MIYSFGSSEDEGLEKDSGAVPEKEVRNMKKLFALVLTVCMLCGCAAMADNTITWEEVAPTVEAGGVTGDWYTFSQIAVQLFIPTGLNPAQVDDANYIGYFQSEDGTSAVAVLYVNVEGMDLDTYISKLPEVGAENIEAGTVNGLPCATYELPANGTMNIAFTTEAGYILEVVVGPVKDDVEKLAASVILASVMPYEE